MPHPPRRRVTAELTTLLLDPLPKCRPQIGGKAELTKRRDHENALGSWDTLGAAPVRGLAELPTTLLKT